MATNAQNLALLGGNVDASGEVDANTLDGLDSLQFLRSDTDDVTTGQLKIGDFSEVTSPNISAGAVIAKSFTMSPYTPGMGGTLTLLNTNTAETTAGFLALGGYYNNTNNKYYFVGGIGGGKETPAGDGAWGGYLSFYTTSDGTAGATSGGFEHMRITADGLVGIGTNAPSAKLHVDNVIQSNDSVDYPVIISQSDPSNSLNQVGGSGVGILFKAATNSTAEIGASIAAVKPGGSDDDTTTDLAFYVSQNDTTLDEAVRIKNNGFVGIGTNSPVEKLYVNSDSGDVRIGLNAPTGSDAEIKFSNNNIVEYTIGHDDATDNFVIGTTNVDADLVSVTKAGNVGIGTTSPSDLLHIKGSDTSKKVLGKFEHTNQHTLYIEGQWGSQDLGGTNGSLIYNTGGVLGFRSGTSGDAPFILKGSNVGIGTASPLYPLHAYKAGTSGHVNIVAETGDVTGHPVIQTKNPSADWDIGLHGGTAWSVRERSASFAKRLTVAAGGNVGIGGSMATGKLNIASGTDATGQGNGIHFYGTAANNQAAIQSFNASAYDGDLRFYTSDHSSASTTIGDERMRIDQYGRVTMPYQPAFGSTKNGHWTETAGGNIITSWTAQTNIGSHFNTSTGRFTAPVQGTYHFDLNVMTQTSSGDLQFQFYKNGSQIYGSNSTEDGSSYRETTISANIYLNVGDYVDPVQYSNTTNSNVVVYTGVYSHYHGYLIG